MRALMLVVLTLAISASIAIAFSGSAAAISGIKPLAVVLCKFTDQTFEPHSAAYYQDMFSETGSGKKGLFDFWKDVSYGNLDLTGSVAKGWYTVPMTFSAWSALGRGPKLDKCASQALGDISFSQFAGVLVINNTGVTTLSASIGTGTTTLTVNSSTPFPPAPFTICVPGCIFGGEPMTVTAINGNSWTVTRGGTPTTHGAGAMIEQAGGDLFGGPPPTTINGTSYGSLGRALLPQWVDLTLFEHETGHSFGLDHSRRLSQSASEYNDCYDIMSAYSCVYRYGGTYQGSGGPGLNAITLENGGWLPGGRRYDFNNSSCGQQSLQLAPLSMSGVSGYLAARIPAARTIQKELNTTTTSDYYYLEFRDQSGQDAAIPADGVVLHLRGTEVRPVSYWVDQAPSGANFFGPAALAAGSEYVDAGYKTYIAVNTIDTSARYAVVTLGGCKIDATLTYAGQTTQDFNDVVTLSADFFASTNPSAPVPFAIINFTLGTQSCSALTNVAGHAVCSFTITQHPGAYTVSAAFAGDPAYNPASDSKSFTINKEQSLVTYSGPLAEDYHDTFTASATLVDPDGSAPIAGKTVTFTLGGGDTCSAVTDGSGNAACSITPTQVPASYALVVAFAGDIDYLSSSDTKTFTIRKEETSTTYTGPTVILQGSSGVTLQAQLLEDGTTAPVPFGQTITLSLGVQSCNGTTDSSGIASCTLTFNGALGPQPLKADFAGDAYYLPSSDIGKTAIVFAFPSHGAFVLGDDTVAAATPSTVVTWWDSSWSKLVDLSSGDSPSGFKGFADTVVTLPTTSPANSCGSTWTSTAGNSPPPTTDVPTYMGVLVTSSVTKSGTTVSGNFAEIVVVITDPGYAPDPGHPGTGRIVATFCK